MIKDEEIDLTEHRDFRGENFSPRFITRNGETFSDIGNFVNNIVQKRIFGNIPWTVVPITEHYRYDGLVALGNKEQRKDAIALQNWGTRENKFCDCCGKKYIKIPWKMDWGLCKECSEQTEHRRFRERLNWIRIGE